MSRPATARLFLAIELPLSLRQELACWALAASRATRAASRTEPERARPSGARRRARPLAMRLIDAESMHLTLAFLGSRPAEQIDPLASLIESLEPPPSGEASLGAPLWLPTRAPRALAVEVHDLSGTIAAAHRSLTDSLQAAGLTQSEPEHGAARRRPLRPHVTVARLRAGAAPRERALPATPQRSFPVGEVVLYRSWLAPEGASYAALARSEAPQPR